MGIYTKNNFHKHTYCEFEMIAKNFFLKKTFHYKSKSGSLYFYTCEGVYRYSNHWGRVANCRWKISGIENYKNQNYYVGYAKWKHFWGLNENRKLFYLEFDSTTEKAIIVKVGSENPSRFLMSLNLAIKRQKQIKALFKNHKWALYYNKPVEVVQDELIKKLINSDETLRALKQNLRRSFKQTQEIGV